MFFGRVRWVEATGPRDSKTKPATSRGVGVGQWGGDVRQKQEQQVAASSSKEQQVAASSSKQQQAAASSSRTAASRTGIVSSAVSSV